MTFGALSLAGASLTIASIAVLPVLIGLAVDYAIQLQSRIAEERGASGAASARRRARPRGGRRCSARRRSPSRPRRPRRASPCSRSRRCRWCAASGSCSSPASRSRSPWRCWRAPPRSCSPSARRRRRAPRGRRATAPRSARRAAAGARRVAGDAAARRVAPAPRRARLRDRAGPARVLAIALAVAAAGWALDTQTRVESDIQQLVPQDMPALRDLDALQRSTGVGGEVDVLVEGADLTRPGGPRVDDPPTSPPS